MRKSGPSGTTIQLNSDVLILDDRMVNYRTERENLRKPEVMGVLPVIQ